MSVKAALVITWTLFIAGAAVASENHRLCVQEYQLHLQRFHESLPHDKRAIEDLQFVIAQVHVTN